MCIFLRYACGSWDYVDKEEELRNKLGRDKE